MGLSEVVEINGIAGFKSGNLVRATIPVSALVEMDWNPNEMSESQMDVLEETITRDGFLDPLTVIPNVDGKTFSINGGHHRFRIAKKLKTSEVPCDIMWEDKWKDPDYQKLQAVRFNVIKGDLNPEKLMQIHGQVVDRFGKDKIAKLMGYSKQDGFDKIVKQVTKQMKEALGQGAADDFEERAKKAKASGDVSKIIKHLFDEYGAEVDYNFAVFSAGGKEHVYVAMDTDLHVALKALLKTSKDVQLNFNRLLTESIRETIGKLEVSDGPDDDSP